MPTLEAVHLGIVSSKKYHGEREVAWRIKIAAENLGWTAVVDEEWGEQIKDESFDWVICLLPANKFVHAQCPNYLTVFHPQNFLNDQRHFTPAYENYDGYLLTINDRESLKEGLRSIQKELHCIPFYPTVYTLPFEHLTYKELVVMIPVWSNRRTASSFKTLYKLLSQNEQVRFYGAKFNTQLISKGTIIPIPFNGRSVINVLQKHGIVLVLHSNIHNQEQIPSARIFEAAAASAVIISDHNEFVKKHFGDSVFYIDTTQNEFQMYAQIAQHLETIKENPELALEMARKAHQIFIDHFTMEEQLLHLESMHQNLFKTVSSI